MKVLVVSDTHDGQEYLKKAIQEGKKMGARIILHAGDLVGKHMLTILHDSGLPVYYAIGNNESDEEGITYLGTLYGIHMTMGAMELELAGKKIAMTHYPTVARKLADSQNYDVVIYGHTHFRKKEYVGRTLLLNPGNAIGWREESYCALLDLEDMSVIFISLQIHRKHISF